MNVLILGGGISGVSAAKVVLKEGHRAIILESTPELGGTMARIANCRIGFKTFSTIKGPPQPKINIWVHPPRWRAKRPTGFRLP